MAHEFKLLLQCMQNILKSCMMRAYDSLSNSHLKNMMQNKYISSLVTQVDLAVQIISTRVISFMPKY